MTTRIRPLILSGGSGTRLWPLSRADRPKQFLPLTAERPMIVETADRFAGAAFADPILVCNAEHRFLAAEAMRSAARGPASMILEPCGRNTAAAIAVGALAAAALDGPEALVLSAASDHQILDLDALEAAVAQARPAAEAGRIVVFSIAPTRPETGYGYIQSGARVRGLDGVAELARFVEKPDRATAERYLADGGYGWNASLFFFRADAAIAELERFAPKILAAARAAFETAAKDLDFTRLDPDAFAAAPSEPFDTAVMEHTDRGAVVGVDMGWTDVGSFSALWDVADRDGDGVATVGDAVAQDCADSLVWSAGGRLVAAVGVRDLVVADTADAVLIAQRGRAEEVKRLVDGLKAEGRTEATASNRGFRPWGSYTCIDGGPGFLVKRIEVAPGGRLSLQSHVHRAEHWVVVDGVATVTLGERVEDCRTLTLEPNQSTYIPQGWIHRLENLGHAPLALIEVQTGPVLSEDDIVRYDDVYGRSDG